MDAFRTLIRGWLGKVLLVLFLAPLVFVGLESYFAGSSKEDVALKVNDQEISKNELDNWIKVQTNEYLQAANGDQSLLNKRVIEAEVYDAAIVRAVLLQQAEKLGIRLSDEQLGTLIRQQAAFQENGKFSEQVFQNYLMNNRTTVDQLLKDFGQRMSLSLLTNSVIYSALYSSTDAQKLIALLGQERTAHIAELPLNQYAQNFVATDAQIKTYYDAHQKDFMRQANVDVQYVVLSKAQFADKVQVTDADINQQYQAYVAKQNKDASRQISQILITTDQRKPEQALQIAQSIANKLKNGEKFEAMVQQYSDDPVTKAAQGKVDGYNVGVYGDAFDQAVLALQQGQTSAPVKTQYGYHIIRVDHIDGVKVTPLSEIRDQMANEVKAKKSADAFQDAVAAANDIAVQSDAADAIADQYKLQVQTTKGVTLANQSNAVLADSAVKQRLFSKEVVDGDRNLSTVINLKNGDAAWVKVLNYHAERPQTLQEAKAQVAATVKRQEQIKQAQAAVATLLNDLKNKPAAEALAASRIKFENLGPVPRYSQVLPTKLERAIYSVSVPKANFWSATTTDLGEALYVVAVSNVGQNPEFNVNDQQKQQIIGRFEPRGQLELNDYIEYLKSKAEIKKIESK
ncbi:peptidylprolyl isomerase [Acinetobacter qingfengensis]|uniref:Periplasmic chaperone PpiD n=1 Tax=Acinetobacter qingfengensis TaxID=1262585 RepID=A0A1E7R991_9GAMM|nr:SurA N-terminal domain-containing protein [Acinetobacter qingfengensis]KAA8735457.1 peptidylprolyl isomerase [Acinetobacter qingfengensis]OEY95898.1 hypothetical protein BJI46_02995 [Acinetobacter qingfengensis]